jgi:hypothetical protein
MGLELLVADAAQRLPSLTSVKVPAGVDAKAVQAYMLQVTPSLPFPSLLPFASVVTPLTLTGAVLHCMCSRLSTSTSKLVVDWVKPPAKSGLLFACFLSPSLPLRVEP